MEEEKIHIGQIVETVFYQSNKTKSEFAKDLSMKEFIHLFQQKRIKV